MISATRPPTPTRTRLPTGTIEVIAPSRWFAAESVGATRPSDTSQGWIATPTRPVAALRAPRRAAVVEHDLREPVRGRPRRPVEEARAGEARDERVARARDEVARRPLLHDLPLDDDADPVGERRRVLEVVGDEHRRQPELAEELAELGADGAFVWASSAESGSSRSSACGRRARARASATRWRSPPESSRTRARASPPIRNRSSSSCTDVPRGAPKRTFAATSRCGKSAYSWNR